MNPSGRRGGGRGCGGPWPASSSLRPAACALSVLTALGRTPTPEINKPKVDDNLRDAPSETEGILKIGIEMRR
eukprot:5798153-Pyramimonas_sp.AAC.1